MTNIAKYQDPQTTFAGYNHNLVIQPEQFYDMQNMTGDYFPVMSPRKKRGFIRNIPDCQGLLASESLYWVADDKLYQNGTQLCELPLHNVNRTLLSMGANIVIFPDKVIYNTSGAAGNDNPKPIDKKWVAGTGDTIHYSLSTLTDSDVIIEAVVKDTAPEEATNGQYWIDTSGGGQVLKVYSSQQEEWSSVATTYIWITAAKIGKGFKKYDAVTLKGFNHDELNGSFVIWNVKDNAILVTALLSDYTPYEVPDGETISVERTMPDIDFPVESENRIWGCKWDNTINEIYASAQGDPTNWSNYMGTSQDSYTLSLGSDGAFTGSTVHGGYVMFFKENVIHKLYGSKPSNYQLTNVTARGIGRGSDKSAVIVNETLYYLSKNGVCQYAGGSPSGIYNVFGGKRYKNAVAGRMGDKYYISMADNDNKYHVFTYDETMDMWFKEDNLQFKFCSESKGNLYIVDANNDLWVADYENYDGAFKNIITEEPDFEWFAETGDIGIQEPDYKFYQDFQIRLTTKANTKVKVYMQYDSDGEWHLADTIEKQRKGCYTIPIHTPKVDHFKMKIAGKGDCKIYLISKYREIGSEVRNYGHKL